MLKCPWWIRGGGGLPDYLDIEQVDDPGREVYKLATGLVGQYRQARREVADDAEALYQGNTSIQERKLGVFVDPEPPSYNLIQSITDTSASHLVRNKVRPYFLTEKGNSELQEKAKGMQRAVEAVFTESGIYGELGTQICYDGHKFEAGGVKITPDYANMRLSVERVDVCDIYVSDEEAKFGKPRQLFHVQRVDRSILLYWAKDESTEVLEAIANAKPAASEENELLEPGEIADQVLVVEAWHLPSCRVDRSDPKVWGYNEGGEFDKDIDPGHDGRRIICIEGQTILDEPWPFDYFPFAWFKPMPRSRGYWSRSVPETLAGAQLAINRMNTRIDGIMHLHSVPRLVVNRQAKLNTNTFSNGWAAIHEVNGPPSNAVLYVTPQSVPAEYVNRVDKIIAWAEKQWGLNEMALTGAKPAGVDHAPGMQHLSDELNVRHTIKFRAWETFHLDAARISVDAFRMLAEHAKRTKLKFELVWGESKDLKRIDWGKVDLGEDRYHLKVHPTNLLPMTPGAKKSAVIDMLNAKLFTREQAMLALDYPDIESLMGDQTATRENIERKLDDLAGGASITECMPHPYLNLEMSKMLAAERINRLEADGEKDESIEPLRKFFELVVNIQNQEMAKEALLAGNTTGDAEARAAMAGPAPPGPMPPPMPGAPPGPPMPGAPMPGPEMPII